MNFAFALLAVVLTIAGYAPYIRDTRSGKTRPHMITWTTWTLATTVAFLVQVDGGAGAGSLVTLSAAATCAVVCVTGWRHGSRSITPFDTMCLGLALLAGAAWLVAGNPLMAALFACVADALGFVPTVRKCWHDPRTETRTSYAMNAVRFGVAILALDLRSTVTQLYPVSWLIMNAAFALFLVLRTHSLSESPDSASLLRQRRRTPPNHAYLRLESPVPQVN